VTLLLDPEKHPTFDSLRVKSSGYEFWNVMLAPDALKVMFAMPQVQMEENAAIAGAAAAKTIFAFDTAGLEDEWKKISASCGTGRAIVQPRIYHETPASPAQRVKTTAPEPGSVWPGVIANSPPENKVDP
jgi:hypothetical protein